MKNIMIFLTLSVFTLLVISCSKDAQNLEVFQNATDSEKENNVFDSGFTSGEQTPDNYKNSDYFITFYFDNQPVDNLTFDQNKDQWVLYLGKLDENKNLFLEVRKFTKKEDYITFGDENSIPIRKSLELGDILREYARDNNIVDFYEKEGYIPQHYKEYENTIYQRYFGSNVQSRAPLCALWENCNTDPGGQGNSIVMYGSYPFMPPSWNNRVSQHEIIALYGGIFVYDKTFYRKHLGTIWGPGFTKYCWHGLSIDDDMTSGFCIS